MSVSLIGCGSNKETSKDSKHIEKTVEEMAVDYGTYGDKAKDKIDSLLKDISSTDDDLAEKGSEAAIKEPLKTDKKITVVEMDEASALEIPEYTQEVVEMSLGDSFDYEDSDEPQEDVEDESEEISKEDGSKEDIEDGSKEISEEDSSKDFSQEDSFF